MRSLSQREKLILCGLYLSKFDKSGLARLGLNSFTEAFNVLGFGLKGRPTSLKNYRDEFDPIFPNPRQGWHKRPLRDYCRVLNQEFGRLELDEFANLLQSLVGEIPNMNGISGDEDGLSQTVDDTTFAKRLITGIAAETYFEQVFPRLELFQNCNLTNTTQFGCGFDFKIAPSGQSDFFAVEVKGLSGQSGTVVLTEKEHRVAQRLHNRYFLFVVRNFEEEPFHTLYRDPLHCGLALRETRRTVEIVNWAIPIIA